MAENANWPLLSAIQLQTESSLTDRTPNADIVEFFDAHPPLTPAGIISYARALKADGKNDAAEKAMHTFFLTRDFGSDAVAKIMNGLPGMVTADDIVARTDRLIWQERYADASGLLAYIQGDSKKILETRLAMLQQKTEADLWLNQLSDDEQNDPGILFARAHWRRALGFNSSAASYLAKIDDIPGHEDELAKERTALARSFLAQNDSSSAFDVVAAQPTGKGQNITQNIWLAGWIALRFEHDVSAAAKYFKTFDDEVATPVSKARAAYWLGRAADAAGEDSVAPQWYRVAAQYGTTFYGQLAAEKLGEAITLPPKMSDSIHDKILQDERIEAAQFLLRQNDIDNARCFFRAVLNDAKEQQEFAALANWANQHNQPHWAVLASKADQQKGFIGLRAGYPILAKNIRAEFDPRLPPELAHGIIRQESEFDTGARSSSGALGLMQLLPGTAKQVAHKVGAHYSEASLTSTPARNVQLGSHYLADQLNNFSNPYLAIAAYNAGPSRVRQWMQTYGDPRKEDADMIDWIESIPSYETRNYVQRVTENQKVYAALLQGAP